MGRLGEPRQGEPRARRPAWLGVLIAVSVCTLASAPAGADAPTPNTPSATEATSREAYERAIDRALDEHERGHFQEAREHFRAAHELMPSARTLRGLGKVEFELRNYGEAVRLLTAALASDVKPLGPELREEVTRVLDRARAYVGEVHVDVQPGSASVSVDGVTVASGPQAALALLVGDHILEFRATGRLPERRRIHVRGGEQVNIQVVLAAPELTAHSRASLDERRPNGPPAYKKWWVWTLVGAVAAGAATGIVIAATYEAPGTRPVSGGSSNVVLRNP